MNALGQVYTDPFAVILGTDFDRFVSPHGIHGQCRVRERQLDLLTVMAFVPGRGHFRAFIEACKGDFDRIDVLEVWNPYLPPILKRYGFDADEIVEEGRPMSVLRWQRSTSTAGQP